MGGEKERELGCGGSGWGEREREVLVITLLYPSPFSLISRATRKPNSNRTRSVSHTSSDMDQYSDASEYFDLDSTNQTLQSSPASSSTIHRPQPSLSTEYLDLTPSSSQFSTPSSSAEVTVVSEQREHDEGVADNTEKSHDKSPDTVEVSHEDTMTKEVMEVEGGKGDITTDEVLLLLWLLMGWVK